MNTAEEIATELVSSMQTLVAGLAKGSPVALDQANTFFCRTFPDTDAAWAECEAFGDDCAAMLEGWRDREAHLTRWEALVRVGARLCGDDEGMGIKI